jgi:hypothetical protein
MSLSSAQSKEPGMGPKTKKPRSMAGLVSRYKKPDSMAGFLKASRCVHSSSRWYKNKSIPRGKGFFHPESLKRKKCHPNATTLE